MLNAIIRLSLQYRFVTIAPLVVLVYGGYTLFHLPIDAFPDLNRPRVTIITEAHGLAPEEVRNARPSRSNRSSTAPLASKRSAASATLASRSSTVEFDWGTNIYTARQIVAEKSPSPPIGCPKEWQAATRSPFRRSWARS